MYSKFLTIREIGREGNEITLTKRIPSCGFVLVCVFSWFVRTFSAACQVTSRYEVCRTREGKCFRGRS